MLTPEPHIIRTSKIFDSLPMIDATGEAAAFLPTLGDMPTCARSGSLSAAEGKAISMNAHGKARMIACPRGWMIAVLLLGVAGSAAAQATAPESNRCQPSPIGDPLTGA